MKIEDVLNELAYKNVSRDEEQIQIIDAQIQAKKEEQKLYISGTVEKLTPKSAHLAHLQAFDDDIDALRIQRNAVIDQYAADLEAYKALDSTKWTALAIVADEELRNSEWMLIEDSALSTDQKTLAKNYRKSLMDLKKDHDTADSAILTYMALEKPNYKLW